MTDHLKLMKIGKRQIQLDEMTSSHHDIHWYSFEILEFLK